MRRKTDPPQPIEMTVADVRRDAVPGEAYDSVTIDTDRGDIQARLYAAEAGVEGRPAVVCVGGVGGGFDTPVRGRLYPWLGERLPPRGVSVMRVRYRNPVDLEEATLDTLAGLEVLRSRGATAAGVVGHSFGGAVAINAAAGSDLVTACVTLATQTYGVAPAADLGPRVALLVCHGSADTVLPDRCSRHVYQIAREPKRLEIRPGVGHGMDEWGDELPGLVRDWLVERLTP